MKQVHKFYLSSFLKNQTYFVPIFIIFFQDLGLSYSEIFWVLTFGSIFSFLIEIPTGIVADLYGKRVSIIISKGIIAASFIAFGLSTGFWTLLLANLLYELGKSFRSGTETAFIYDYLQNNKNQPSYTSVKAKQKFYARLSESIAAAFGGFVAVYLGFNIVFFLAAIPAVINFFQVITWSKVKEFKGKKDLKHTYLFTKKTFRLIWKTDGLSIMMANVVLFTASFLVLATFIQPYMKEAGLPLQYFGVIYSAFLIIAAFLTRYSSNLEKKYGGRKVMNILTLAAVAPLIILGFGFTSIIGIGLFFFVLLIENLRSPIANTLFHKSVESSNRATSGSILALSKTAGQIILLPIVGYVADLYSIYTAILTIGIIILITSSILYVRPIKQS